MSRDTEFFDQMNAEPLTDEDRRLAAQPWSAKMSDVYSSLRDDKPTVESLVSSTVAEFLEDNEVHVTQAPPKVPVYNQLRDDIGEILAALETELHGLVEAIEPILGGSPADPLTTPQAPVGSQMEIDLTIVRDRIAELVHQAHDARTRAATA